VARVANPDGLKLQGFAAGVNNVAPAHDLPTDEFGKPMALTAAVNVDLVGPKKKPRQREGYTKQLSGRAHSPMTLAGVNTLFVVVDDALNAYDESYGLIDTIRTGVGPRLTSAEIDGDLYWSSASEMRRIRRDDMADLPFWIGSPGTPLVDAYPTGGMAAGAYRVAMTWFDADGRESGAAGLAYIELAEGQGIRVHNIPVAPEGAVRARVYVSPPNEEELYAALDLMPGVTQTLLGVNAGGDGRALETLWLQPLPPCDILRYWNNRVIAAAGNMLIWSPPYRFGLTTQDNYLRMGQRITLLEPVGAGSDAAGCWVADHKYTYWMDGSKPDAWRRVVKYDHPAVFGTSLLVKGTVLGLDTTELVAFWVAANGVFCVGLPGGQLVTPFEGRLAPVGGVQGASLFREFEGMRQLVTSYIGAGDTPNRLAIGDRAAATVTRANTP
jgi:hypothetical protein